MPKSRVTRRQLLAATAPVVAAVPLARLALDKPAQAATPHVHHPGMAMAEPTHAAMSGHEVPAPGGPRALDALLPPPPALPHEPGRVR